MFPKIKVLELYSGIGGMHFSLRESEINYEVVAAADINTTANKVYEYNFPETRLMTKCIEAIPLKEWNKLGMDMIVMSPPCQPYCRVGKQKDVADQRTKSFLHLLSILPKLDKPVDYILVENVKGFDTSESRDRLLHTLASLRFHVQEFLLSPLQFGIPNSRLRYYMIAKRSPLQFHFDTTPKIRTDIPDCVASYLVHRRAAEDAPVTSDAQEQRAKRPRVHVPCNCTICARQQQHAELERDRQSQDQSPQPQDKSSQSPDKSHQRQDKSPQPPDACNSSEETKKTFHVCATSPEDLPGVNILPQNTEQSQESKTLLHKTTELDKTQETKNINDLEDSRSKIHLHEKYREICGKVGDYLENEEKDYFDKYLIEEKFFRRFWVMDLVTGESRNSCCFTKRYAHHMEGSGSIIEMNTAEAKDMSHFKAMQEYTDELHEAVRIRKLRYFSPREIANLLCFPKQFSFPADMKNIQMYRVLGNSLNVHVVAVLLRALLYGP